MALWPNEFRIWITGLPKSAQSKDKIARAYVERIREAARAKLTAGPVLSPIEVTIVFADWASRPDVDNVDKRVIDALKGIAFVDDRQVTKVTIGVLDHATAAAAGERHFTFQRLIRGEEFLIRILVEPTPTISWDVESS